MVNVTPGPVAATVPIRIDSAASRACAFSIAAWSLLPDACSEASVRCRSATSLFSAASRCCSESSSTNRSAGRAVSSESPDSFCLTWVTIATPSSTHSSTPSAPNTSCDRPRRDHACDPAGLQGADLRRASASSGGSS